MPVIFSEIHSSHDVASFVSNFASCLCWSPQKLKNAGCPSVQCQPHIAWDDVAPISSAELFCLTVSIADCLYTRVFHQDVSYLNGNFIMGMRPTLIVYQNQNQTRSLVLVLVKRAPYGEILPQNQTLNLVMTRSLPNWIHRNWQGNPHHK